MNSTQLSKIFGITFTNGNLFKRLHLTSPGRGGIHWSLLLLSLFLAISFFIPFPVQTQTDLRRDVLGQIEAGTGARGADLGVPADPRSIIAGVIKVFLGLLGMIFMVLIIMGGYWYLTARGEEDKIDKATRTIRSAIIGLFVVLIAYGITTLVVNKVLEATSGRPTLRGR